MTAPVSLQGINFRLISSKMSTQFDSGDDDDKIKKLFIFNERVKSTFVRIPVESPL